MEHRLEDDESRVRQILCIEAGSITSTMGIFKKNKEIFIRFMPVNRQRSFTFIVEVTLLTTFSRNDCLLAQKQDVSVIAEFIFLIKGKLHSIMQVGPG